MEIAMISKGYTRNINAPHTKIEAYFLGWGGIPCRILLPDKTIPSYANLSDVSGAQLQKQGQVS